MTVCATCMAVTDRIDQHLKRIPEGRTLLSVDDHIDILLDVRNLVEPPEVEPEPLTVQDVLRQIAAGVDDPQALAVAALGAGR